MESFRRFPRQVLVYTWFRRANVAGFAPNVLAKTAFIRGKSGYMGRLSSQENWLVVKRQLFAAMMHPTTHIIHNKSDDPNFSTLVTRKGFVRPISPDKFSLRRVIRTTHMGAMIWVY